jgi:plastocyanin domain-containing protein
MRIYSIISGAALIAFGGLGTAYAQTAPVHGTHGSPFPYASRHEVQMINGVPCRTMYDRQSRMRVPVACAGTISVPHVDVSATGSTAAGVPLTGTPASPFPYASAHEVQMINGVPCRTMYDRQSRGRVPIACAGEVSVHRVN